MDRSAAWAEPLDRCMLVLTCALLLCEVIVGRICNSLINMIDSFHTLYILLNMIISTQGAEQTPNVSTEPRTEPKDKSWTSCIQENRLAQLSGGSLYSRFRVRPVGGLISALLLSSLCVSISFDTLSHTVRPHPIQHPLLAMAVGAVSLLFNLLLVVWRKVRPTEVSGAEAETPLPPPGFPTDGVLMFCNPGASSVLTPDSKEHTLSHDFPQTETLREELKSSSTSGHDETHQCEVSERTSSIIMVFSSLLASALVLLNGLLHLLCLRFQWTCDVILYLDPAFSMLTALVLLAVMVPEIWRHGTLLLQASPAGVCTEELMTELGRVPGVLAVHELHVWQLSETCVVASVHVHSLSGLSALQCSQLLRSITKVLRSFGVKRCTVQPEFLNSHPEYTALQPLCTLRCGKECVNKMCCLPP